MAMAQVVIKPFTSIFTLLVLFLSLTAQATILKESKPTTIDFKKHTTITLPASDKYHFFRVNEHQQITYVKIHHSPAQYFYDTYNAFPYYDTLIPPHKSPLTISVHTFLKNNNPNQVTVELISTPQPSLLTVQGHESFKQGYSAIIRNYLNETKDDKWNHFFKAALEAFEQDNNHLWAGIAANQLAGEYRINDQSLESIKIYQKAIDHFTEANAPEYRWYSEGRLGLAEWRVNRLDKAMQRFKNVADHGQQLGLTELVRTAFNNIGLMHWAKREIHQAIYSFQQSLQIANISEDSLFKGDISKLNFEDSALLNNLALAYQNLGKTEKAASLFRTKLEATKFLKDFNQLFISYINLANLLRTESQYDLALAELKKADSLEKSGQYNSPKWWSNQLQIMLGRVYSNLGLTDLAKHHYQQALSKANPENFKRQRIETLLALVLSNKSKNNEKKQWLTEAEQLLVDAKLKVQEAKVLEIKAQQAFELKNHTQAIELYTQAKDTLKDQHKIIQSTNLGLQIATVFQAQDKHKEAIKHLESSLVQLPQTMDRLLANQLNNALAYSQWQSGDKAKALTTIQQSVDALNALIPHITYSKTQQQLKLQVDETLTLYSMLYAKEQDPAKTLAFISQQKQLWQSSRNQENQSEASKLFSQIGNISHALENKRLSDDTREQMERELISLNNQLDYLSKVENKEQSLPNIQALQAQMADDELTIMIMTGEYGSIAWWVSKDEIKCEALKNRDTLALWVEQTRQTIADQARLNQVIKDLSNHLFAPLSQHPKAKRIHMIVDAPLNVLPMLAMPIPGESTPLIDKYTLSLHSQLSNHNHKKVTSLTSATYFANPVHHHTDPRLPEGSQIDDVTEFAPLNGTTHEVYQTQKFIPGTVKQGFDANKTAFQELNNDAQVLHMATHAFFNETHPDLSALVLSAINEQGESQAAMVRAAEIRNMDIPHELVVLSGCETGLSSGNGLTGLTQSFLQAGAQNLISSLWQVDDRVTSQMMTLLYQNLSQGQNINDALRNAQIHIKSQHTTRHPKYWAGWFHISH